MKRSGVYRLTYIAIMVALATVLHVVEAMIPIPYVFPGAKLGLANIVALYAVMTSGFADAIAVSLSRTLLGSLISGTFLNVGYYLSTAGAVLSTIVMYAVHRLGKGSFSPVGISVAGAVSHNVGQLLVATVLFKHTGVMFYLPYLLLFAIPTGIFVGLLAGKIISYTEKIHARRQI